MNLTFTDINNAFQNLTQSSSLSSESGVFKSSEAPPTLFADNLRQVITDARAAQKYSSVNSAVSGATVAGKLEDLDKAKTVFLEEVGQEKGAAFLSKMKNLFLTLSDGDLDNISIDVQGLDALKKILLKAGFETEELEAFMSGLSEKAEGKDISLSEVMDGLFKLPMESEEDTMDEEIFMETSALPFLTSLLNSLGLPKDTVSQIVSQADRGENGISLGGVIDQLTAIEEASIDTGQLFKTQEGDTSFTMFLEQLGLTQPENTTAQLGLGDLLASLKAQKEKIVDAKNQADDLAGIVNSADDAVKESSTSLTASLFKHMEIQSEKTGLAEFSYEQVRDQLKNDLLIPDKDQSHKNGLFSKEQPGTTTVKSEQFFKELESVQSDKSGTTGDPKSLVLDGEEITKVIKSESAKGGESLQVSAPEIKTDSLGSSLKSTATFKNMPNHVMNQVEKGIVRAINQGESTLKLQLKPAELGRISLTIDNTGNSMKVSIITENSVAKDILASHVNELKTALATVGISLDKFEVDMNSNFQQSMADTKKQFNNSRQRNKNREDNSLDTIHLESQDTGTLTDTIQEGSYHFVA